MIVLENENLKVSVALFGAELRSVINKKTGNEMMWSGDSKYWGRVSPVLFPFVGKVYEGKYLVEGAEYSMGQHGFLRDRTFELVEEESNRAEFSFVSDEECAMIYPFKHEVRIAYELVDSKVLIHWHIYNLDDKTMYYSIGAHPAFALNEGDEYRFEYNTSNEVNLITLDKGHVSGSLPYKDTTILVEDKAFEKDAIVLTGLDSIDLINSSNGETIRCDFTGFDYVGLWSAFVDGKMAPFVCIEPWLGITDEAGGYDDISKKLSIKDLEAKSKHEHVYSLEFL